MFDRSQLRLFRAKVPDAAGLDTTNLFAMLDADRFATARENLTVAQQAALDSYVYVPVAADFTDRGFPRWAGDDPPAVYIRVPGTTTQQSSRIRAVLARLWSADPPAPPVAP